MRSVLLVAVAAVACRDSREPPAARAPASVPIDPITVRVGELIHQLESGDPHERDDAVDQIRGLAGRGALDEDEGVRLIDALPALPAPKGDALDAQTAVVAALADDPRMPYVVAIERAADGLRPAARARAIALVGAIDDPAAARAFLRLLARFPAPSPSLAFARLEEQPAQARILFPALLELVAHPALEDDILNMALAYCEKGAVTAADLAPGVPTLLSVYRDARDELVPAQRASGVAWMWREGYAETRASAATLLDLMGCLPRDEVGASLDEAITAYTDPKLLYTATRSLLGEGRPPPRAVLERVAASDETRVWLYQLLADAGRLDLFPTKARTQQALAASQLAEWLAEPDHLGRVPEVIEPLGTVAIDAGAPDGTLDFFVYRFKTDGPWLAGTAGPYLRRDEPSVDDHGGTFSDLAAVGNRTPEDIVGPPGQIVTDWKRARR